VVPPLGAEYEALARKYLRGGRCLQVGPGIKTGMPIRIDNPYEVGADRLVNAVAAYERFGDACVVVDFGTGINFDAVSAAGEYLGGAIAPGVEISLTALTERGARIPRIDLAEPESAIGKSTRGAIQSGVVYGFAGLIDGVARRIEAELGEGVPFIATGGLAAAIVPFCETIDEVDDLLTLRGLRLIDKRNR
jgi:type III pantothenate kinase